MRTDIHSRDMAHAHNMEDKLKPEMSVKPSALWQKRQVSAWCSLVLCVNMLKCTVLRTYRTFKISSSSALGTKILAWNLKIVGNDVLLLHVFFSINSIFSMNFLSSFFLSSSSLFCLSSLDYFLSFPLLFLLSFFLLFLSFFFTSLGLWEYSSFITWTAITIKHRL